MTAVVVGAVESLDALLVAFVFVWFIWWQASFLMNDGGGSFYGLPNDYL